MTDTTQFKQVKTPSGRVAYEAWTAVWNCCDKHVAISAPTFELLEEAWNRIATTKFDHSVGAQRTYIVKFEDRSDQSL